MQTSKVMSKLSRNPKNPILKLAGVAISMQAMVFGLTLLSLANAGELEWPWREGIASFVLGALLSAFMLLVGVITRTARHIHLIYGVMPVLWIIPLLSAGYVLSSRSPWLLSLIVILIAANIFLSHQATLNRLLAADRPAVRSGRLDLAHGIWHFDRPLYAENGDGARASLARLLIPLGSILGTLLYRNFPDELSQISTLMSYAFASMLVVISGVQFAIVSYLHGIEKSQARPIRF
jgi:hypothetical protein